MLALIALALLQAAAQSDIRPLFTADGSTAYIEMNTVGGPADERSFFVIHRLDKVKGTGTATVRDQWVLNCNTRSFYVLSVVERDKSGKLLKAQITPARSRIAMDVRGTRGTQLVYSLACGQAK